jgi:hypothetical protein
MEGPRSAEQEGLKRLPTMALLCYGTSLLPCLISQPLSQPEGIMDRLQLRKEASRTTSRTAPKTGSRTGVLVAARDCSQ